MLAENLKTPAELGITDPIFDALNGVLKMLERDELRHVEVPIGWSDYVRLDRRTLGLFNMQHWAHPSPCGTVCCIKGTAEILLGSEIEITTRELERLFIPVAPLGTISPSQAAIALRNYLTHGEPRWDEALAS